MYSIDREQASRTLNISTRTIDRYIRAGKIRSQKRGKKVYLNDQDVEILKNGGLQEDYEILSPVSEKTPAGYASRTVDAGKDYRSLYEDSLRTIDKKDDVIKDLSYRLGKAEIDLKNSIPILEYKKTTYLLESASNRSEDDKKSMSDLVESLKEKLRSQELINLTMVIIFALMVVIVFLVWFSGV